MSCCRYVLLLPGDPLECFCAYDLFAGRLIRNLSGRDPALPYKTQHAKAERKFVSPVGTTELCPVRLVREEAFPLGAAGSTDFASIARADGFVLIPETMEGYAPGTPVTVYKHDGFDEAEGAVQMGMDHNTSRTLLGVARQQQFLDVVSRDEAEERLRQYIKLCPLGEEDISLSNALGRVLSRDVVSGVDVPGSARDAPRLRHAPRDLTPPILWRSQHHCPPAQVSQVALPNRSSAHSVHCLC